MRYLFKIYIDHTFYIYSSDAFQNTVDSSYTYVTLTAESFEQIVRLELIFLVGHHSGHLERQPGLGHLVLEQPLAHGIERRRHHVARAHRPEIVHHEHWTFCACD